MENAFNQNDSEYSVKHLISYYQLETFNGKVSD